MRRTAFVSRGTITTKPGKCRYCRKRLERIGEKIHPDCVGPWWEQNREKVQTQARKLKAKTPTKWADECQSIINAIARLRDRHDGCISCHMGANYGGQWHGSHFRSVKAASALRFHLWNIHKACAQCNLHKSGNIAAYTPRLIAKMGQERVDWLYSQNQTVKRDIDYYKKFKRVMGERLRRLQARALREQQEAAV